MTQPGKRLQNRQVAAEFVVSDLAAEVGPLDLLVGDEAVEEVVAQTAAEEVAAFGVLNGLPEAAGEVVDATVLRSCSVISNTFSSTGSGQAYPSMPSRPAVSMVAKTRYGLQAGSAARYSRRVAFSLPRRNSGTRMRSDRLRRAHDR
jgi:hypothetical protein